MNPDNDQSLAVFLQALRIRLWLQAVLRWTWRGLALTALWLSGAGLVHTLLHALPLPLCLLVALLPVSITLLVGGWRGRPSLDHCAQVADRWFDGKALLTSAWDLYHHLRSAHPASTRLISRQAQQAVLDWHGQLQQRPFWPPLPNHALISISFSLIGIFLLIAPGAMPKREEQAFLSAPAVPRPAATSTILNSWQERPVAASSTLRQAVPPPGEPIQAESVPVPPVMLVATQPSPPPADVVSLHHPAASGEKGDDATVTVTIGPGEDQADRGSGSSQPGSGGHATTLHGEPAATAAIPIDWVDLIRTPAAQSRLAGTTGMELFTTAAPPQHTAPAAGGTAQTVVSQYEAPFGLALRPYIARYFELLHEQQPGSNRPADPIR